MRHKLDTLKTLLAVVTIAFASTVSAVHVHDIVTCSQSNSVAVESAHEAHDCFYCLVVYQTLTADSDHVAFVLSTSEAVLPSRSAIPVPPFSFDWYGRAPPFSA